MMGINDSSTVEVSDRLGHQLAQLTPAQMRAFQVAAYAYFFGVELPEADPQVLVQQAYMSFSESEDGRDFLTHSIKANNEQHQASSEHLEKKRRPHAVRT